MRAAMAAYANDDHAAITALDTRLSAMKIAQETREASHKIGRQMLRTFLALEPDDLLEAYQRDINEGVCAGQHTLVHGLAYAHFDIEEAAALLAYAYGQIAGQVAAAIKLVAIGQTSAQQILHDLIPVMQQAVEEAQSRPLDDLQAFTPALEIRAMQHHYLFRRLFIS